MKQGHRFERLVAISETERAKSGNAQWVFLCDCGALTIARTIDVTRGFKRSCGCLLRETSAANGKKYSTTHGMFGTSIYNTWARMIQRCVNPKDPSYKYYGARGIKVCKRWLKFENFFADMGNRPIDGLTLDRVNNDGNYEPSNCRWATASQQAKNKRFDYARTRPRNAKGQYLPATHPNQRPL